jgi:diguanylate cyclase
LATLSSRATVHHLLKPGRSSQAVTGDGELLLSAVQARLRTIVGGTSGANGASPVADSSARMKADVLECVDALGALQTALTHGRSRHRWLECELVDAQAALTQSRAALAATRHDERRARHLALHDSLTGLPNRRCFGERLDRALATVEPNHRGLAVLYLDLDGLKAINDRHGHDTGDELLQIVAARLRGALRTQDMVCRLGGDEFACLLNDPLNREQLEHLACKLFDTVSAPIQIGERTLVVRPSIGIAACPADGTDGATLLKHADCAMYRAKREQSGYMFFGDSADRLLITRAPPAPASLCVATPTPTNPAGPLPGQAPPSAAAATKRQATPA